jgi:2-C-methyl-D-erythritol 4-phosphate cytidylyltransferase
VPGFAGPRAWAVRSGGETRAATVSAGLEALSARGAADDDWVLVHDAARCLLQPAWVDALIDACLEHPVGGLLALPVTDTLKQADAEGGVASTVDRSGKWAAQTPQMFRLGLLRRALAEAGPGVTDESSAVEALGLAPRLVAAPLENFKLTWPADFELAERLLAARGAGAAPLPLSAAPAAEPHPTRAVAPPAPGPMAGTAAAAAEIKAFVPARRYAASLRFYLELGAELVWDRGDLAHLRWGGAGFLLQDFAAPGFADNFVLHLQVPDLDAWWSAAEPVARRHGVRSEAPAERPWGQRDAVLLDPGGVLWRVAQWP